MFLLRRNDICVRFRICLAKLPRFRRHSRASGDPEVFRNAWIPGRPSYRQLAGMTIKLCHEVKLQDASIQRLLALYYETMG